MSLATRTMSPMHYLARISQGLYIWSPTWVSNLLNPSFAAGGIKKIITSSVRSRQPVRLAWPYERLIRERAIALGQAIDNTTSKTYESALNSYLNFVKLHNLPLEPTPNILSLFTVYMAHQINPRSVASYLSGILQQLEPYFPEVQKSRSSPLVTRMLQGCLQAKSKPVSCKCALTLANLTTVLDYYNSSLQHDDLLFVAMLLTGFFALMRLGEMAYPDNPSIQDFCKVTKWSSLQLSGNQYFFHLLAGHKADRFFEGNLVIIRRQQLQHDPLHHFWQYLFSQDRVLSSISSPLWLTEAGDIPTRSFLIHCLRQFFGSDVGGQSMRAGGATSLTENGTPSSLIQSIGRWASMAFQIYVHKNPILIHALLLGPPLGFQHCMFLVLSFISFLFFPFLSVHLMIFAAPHITLCFFHHILALFFYF